MSLTDQPTDRRFKYAPWVDVLIFQLWGQGKTAAETAAILKSDHGISMHEDTVLEHRHNKFTQKLQEDIVNELVKEQVKDIQSSDIPDQRMKYRQMLIETFKRLKTQDLSHNNTPQSFKVVVNENKKQE